MKFNKVEHISMLNMNLASNAPKWITLINLQKLRLEIMYTQKDVTMFSHF